MEVLTTEGDPEAFFRQLAKAGQGLLLTDYDGTLAPFRDDPSQAYPYPGVTEVLEKIHATAGRIVVVSGRKVDEVSALLPLPELEIWGAHGRERRHSNGTRWTHSISSEAARLLEEAQHMLKTAGLADRCEVKPGCLAVHHRGLAGSEKRRVEEIVHRTWNRLEKRDTLELHAFDGGLELRTAGVSKGKAVAQILEENDGFSGPVAFLGDDLTDEDAFRVLVGKALRVLVRTEFRSTNADLWIRPPEELLWFLQRWCACLQGGILASRTKPHPN